MVPTAAPVTAAPVPLPEPLRLPRGSVRGLLALGLMGTFGYLVFRGTGSLPAVLVNSVVVALAFYFGSHGPAAQAAAASAPGTAAPTHRPRIVRALLLAGFGGLAAWLVWTGLAIPAEFLQVLEVLGGYVLGMTLAWFFHRRVRESLVSRRVALVFRDLSAAAALALTAVACYGFVSGALGSLANDVEQALSLVITYYFGSRVMAR